MPSSRTLAEVLQAHGDTLRDDIKKVIPATVIAVHPTRQTVDVQIAVKNPIADEFGNIRYEDQPSFADVPLGVLRGGGFFVWVPVAIGDSVLLMFSDLSMDTWRQSGSSEPAWVGKHTADSPIAIPCIAPDPSFFVDPGTSPTKLIVGKDGSTAQIRLSATDIELGAGATDALGLASKIDAAVTTIVTAFNLHVHTSAAPGNPTTPPVTPIAPAPGTVASTLIRAR